MKYPQLVSTRAVNAISDWLVSRLEQLGVEAPQPYTRLLLSLLQSTIQLNDPIELSNLESFLASRKGGNRRYQNCDTDALKKFNAVQCLKEIVSAEQEIATIENLVDELFEKLKDIEKQTDESDDENKLFVATLNLTQQAHQHNTHISSAHHQSHNKSHHHHNYATKEIPAHSKNCNISKGVVVVGGGVGGEIGKQTPIQTAAAGTTSERGAAADSVQDPLDLYCRAFPALSKEMENSFVTYRRNVKWLTWPPAEQHAHRRRDHTISISSSSSTISSNSGAEGEGSAKDVGGGGVGAKNRSQKEKDNKMLVDNSLENATKIPRHEFEFDISVNATVVTSGNSDVGAAGIKRKTKRRRSQGLSKGKTIQSSTRKNLTSGTATTSLQTTTSAGRNKRNASPAYWDTDFEGCWEMGRDLIKEFITRQNRNSRNRSTSESAVAYNKKHINEMANTENNIETDDDEEKQICKDLPECANFEIEDAKSKKSCKDTEKVTPAAMPPPVAIDFSFCDYDEFDDTLASVSELTNDEPLLKLCANKPKRLYERELLTNADDMKSQDEQSDFARFEAKFNSNVEALWKDDAAAAGTDDEKAARYASIGGDENKMPGFDFGNSVNMNFSAGPTSLPCDMPFKQNLKNFWTNYYNHHFDLNKMLPASLNVLGQQQKLNAMMQQNKPQANRGVSAAYVKSNIGIFNDAAEKVINFPNSRMEISTAQTSDYYSMPSTLDNSNKVNMQRCGVRHNSGGCSESGGGIIGEERKTPVALFLHSSIWSENANMNGGDTDESFFYKVHNSGKRLNASNDDNINCCGGEHEPIKNVSNNSSGFAFTTSYTGSKWSEGINAGPNTTGTQKSNTSLNMSLNGTDCTDSSTCSTMTTAGTSNNWQLIKSGGGGNTLPAVSLQDTWRGATANQATTESKAATQKQYPTAAAAFYHERGEVETPKVTLVNHSPGSSGFIAYSRIKSVLQLQLSSEDSVSKQQQINQRNYATRAKEQQQLQQRYALDMLEDGENLLTSERTHFHPIKSYVDGHTFDICSELDVIDYQRSTSGYLYYEQDKYLEYTRNDNYMVEDDGAASSSARVIGASANPLYANSNCEAAATAKYKHNNNMRKYKRSYEHDFVIKFRLQRTEIACQTDVVQPTTTTNARALIGVNHKRVFGLNMMTTSASNKQQTHPLSIIFSNAAKNLKANTAANQLVYSDTVEAFTRAMAHFPPPPSTTAASNSIWLPVGSGATDMMNEGASQSVTTKASHIWNIYQQSEHSNKEYQNKNAKTCSEHKEDGGGGGGYDEVDFYGADLTDIGTTASMVDADVDMTSLEQEWSMNEIRRKCKEAGHMNNYMKNTNANANNNNIAGTTCVTAANDGVVATSGGGGDCAAVLETAESVWGMCAACNSELKSIPANRLLRDELQVEADEIMSDLKYMQDLYIGRAGDRDGDDDDDDDDVDADDEDDGCVADDESGGADTVTSDSDWCAEDLTTDVTNEIKMNMNAAATSQQQHEATLNAHATDAAAITNESDTLTVIQKVNRLIAELLRPDNNNDAEFNMEEMEANVEGTKAGVEERIAATNEVTETEAIATTSAAAPQFSGNLWHTSNMERNIWQLNAADSDNGIKFGTDMGLEKITVSGGGGTGDIISDITNIHPLQLLRQFNVKPIETMEALPNTAAAAAANIDACDVTHMSWEHDNLARIWQTSPKSHEPQQHATQEQQQSQTEQKRQTLLQQSAENIASSVNTFDSCEIPLDANQQKIEAQEEYGVAEKNMRNLRANADASVEAAAANFQKAQDFLISHQSQNKATSAGVFTGAELLESALKLKAATRKRRHSASQNLFHTQIIGGGVTTEAAAAKVNAASKSCTLTGGTAALLHNNNNNKIADLNSYALESNNTAAITNANTNALNFHKLINASLHFGAAAAAAVAASNAKKCSDYATSRQLCGGTDLAYGCDATAAAAKNQTIITCKYHLTTIEPIMAMHKNNDVDDDDDNNGIDNDVGLFDGIATTAPLSCMLDKNSSILNHVTMMSRPLTR